MLRARHRSIAISESAAALRPADQRFSVDLNRPLVGCAVRGNDPVAQSRSTEPRGWTNYFRHAVQTHPQPAASLR